MRRKSVLLTLTILLAAVGLVFAGLYVTLTVEPEFYTAVPESSGVETAEKAAQFITRVQDFKNDIRAKPDWGAAFRADDLNSFFRENLDEGGGLTNILPAGFHTPRVSIEGDTFRLGVRYGTGTFSTVFSVQMRAWLVKDEVNVIALELCSLNAGSLSVGCQSLLDNITEAAHDSNVEVTWYRHNGNPVGLFRFYADQLRPTTQIHTFRIADGTVTVAGRTRLENAAAQAPPGVGSLGE